MTTDPTESLTHLVSGSARGGPAIDEPRPDLQPVKREHSAASTEQMWVLYRRFAAPSHNGEIGAPIIFMVGFYISRSPYRGTEFVGGASSGVASNLELYHAVGRTAGGLVRRDRSGFRARPVRAERQSSVSVHADGPVDATQRACGWLWTDASRVW